MAVAGWGGEVEGRKSELWYLFLILGCQTYHIRALPLRLSKLITALQALMPKRFILRVRVSTYEFREGGTNLQSIAVVNPVIPIFMHYSLRCSGQKSRKHY